MKEHGSGGGSDLVPISPRAGRPLVPVGLSVSPARLPSQEGMAGAFPGPSASAEPGSCPIPATVSWAGQALPRKWPLRGRGGVLSLGAPLGPGPGCPRRVALRPGVLTSPLLHLPPSPCSVLLVNSRRLPSPEQRSGGGHVLPVGGPGPGRAGGGPPGSSPGAGWGAPWAVMAGGGAGPSRPAQCPGLGRSCWTD